MRRVLKSRVDADSGENIDNGNENAEEMTILMILGDCKHNPLSWRLERLHTNKHSSIPAEHIRL